MAIKKYRKQVEQVDAVQYDGSNAQEIITFTGGRVKQDGTKLVFTYPESTTLQTVSVTDWVMKDLGFGNFSLMNAANFSVTYAPGPQ